MTICVAAIGKNTEANEEFIVFATDHMVSVSTGQFEQVIEKFKLIDEHTVAMFSGQALLFDRIMHDIGNKKEKLTYEQIVELTHQRMKKVRFELFEEQVLSVYDIDFKYVKNILDKQVQNPFIQTILEKLSEHNLGSAVMLIGFKDGFAQVTVVNEFIHYNFRDMNFGAIGSGETQALNTLMFQTHSKEEPLSTTLYNVYKAKRNSEVSVGVGKETDLYVLSPKKLVEVTQAQKDFLEKVYLDELSYGKKDERVKKIVGELAK
ncbi:MAG: hypothetical protein U0R44_00420 [Candidatus Micrarchaeia archaeon]